MNDRTQPGPTWFAVIPCGASSIAMCSVSARSPCFVAP